jgi:hypothetical protein
LLQGLEFTSWFLLSVPYLASLVAYPEKMKKPFSHLLGKKKEQVREGLFL